MPAVDSITNAKSPAWALMGKLSEQPNVAAELADLRQEIAQLRRAIEQQNVQSLIITGRDVTKVVDAMRLKV